MKYKQPSFKYYANIRQNSIQNIPKHTHTQSPNKFKFSATVTEQSDKVSPIIDTKSKSKPKRNLSNSKVTRSSSYHSKSFPSSTELAYVITNRRLVQYSIVYSKDSRIRELIISGTVCCLSLGPAKQTIYVTKPFPTQSLPILLRV